MENNKESIGKELRTTFGNVNVSEGTGAIKTPVMSFSQDNIYLGLKLIAKYDEKAGKHRDPVPRITATFNGRFVDMPLNGKWWRNYADFVDKMEEALEGVDISVANVKDDVGSAKTLMSKFRTVG